MVAESDDSQAVQGDGFQPGGEVGGVPDLDSRRGVRRGKRRDRIGAAGRLRQRHRAQDAGTCERRTNRHYARAPRTDTPVLYAVRRCETRQHVDGLRIFVPNDAVILVRAASPAPPLKVGFALVLMCFAAVPAFETVRLKTVSETSSNASIGDLNSGGHLDIVLVKRPKCGEFD
jgi:hypothetical protein